ncbi:MAG: hypothetical protein ACM33T_11750 [Solirubrobacterales bacterium]
MNSNPQDNKTFEAKVTNLIAATRHLEISQILVLRRLTLNDPESLKWANQKQLGVVFNVILTKAIERFGIDQFKEARARGFEGLLAGGSPAARDEDTRVLTELATQMLGAAPSEAESTQALFERLLALGPAAPKPRMTRQQAPIKEPPPLFAAQLGPEAERSFNVKARAGLTAGQAVEVEDESFTDFNTLFDDTICGFTRKVLALLQVQGPRKAMRVPFVAAPEFAACYEDVLRRFVLPQMRASRHIQTLGSNYNWVEVGGGKLIDIIQGGEVNNPVLHNWDTRWAAFRSTKSAGKVKKPKPEDNPWPLFAEDATRNNYIPPTEDDIQLLQDLVRQEVDAIAKAWREISQLYEQEFSPNARQEQAREGALRDGLMKWASKLPDHIGEFFVIRAYFEFARIDGQFVRRQINNFGRNDTERRRNAPYLVEFAQNLTD